MSTLPISLSRNLLHNIESALSSAATDIKGGQDQIRCESLIAKLQANGQSDYSDIRPGSEFCLSQPPFEQGARFGYMMQHSFVCV